MSAHARDWLDKQRGLTHVEHRILYVLASLAGREGTCYQSYPQLAERCECDEKTVGRAIVALGEAPALVTARRDGRYSVTNYQLQLDTVRTCRPVKEKVETESAEVTSCPPSEVTLDHPSEVTSDHPSNEAGVTTDHPRGDDRSPQGGLQITPAPYNKPEITVRTGKEGADAPPSPVSDGQVSPAAPTAQTILAALIDAQPADDRPTRGTIGRAAKELANLIVAKGAANVAEAFTPDAVDAGLRDGRYPFNSGFAGIWSGADQAYAKLRRFAGRRRETDGFDGMVNAHDALGCRQQESAHA